MASQPLREKQHGGLFIGRVAAYLHSMRIAVFALALFCAILSGWTVSLARVQDLGLAMHAASHDHARGATSDDDGCRAKECRTHAVHPSLCAACFAIETSMEAPVPGSPLRLAVLPRLQKPLQATLLKPLFPPPKPVLS
ncbi:hypothetical protein [Pararhizobium gei]|uniref:hypothetical protein n=1 Tax=Pararhizobium gei TaxID=1395951 RepID=UPI0023DAA006|nr:hypothetical protein [Rhizobium gei]